MENLISSYIEGDNCGDIFPVDRNGLQHHIKVERDYHTKGTSNRVVWEHTWAVYYKMWYTNLTKDNAIMKAKELAYLIENSGENM